MSASLVRSLMANWIGLLIAGLVGLAISPLLVSSLGKEVYGTWTLVASLTAQLAILDFGVRNSLVAFVSRARAQRDLNALSTTLSTSLSLLTILGVLSFFLVVISLPFIESLFNLDPSLVQVFRVLLVIYAIDAGIELAFGVFNGALAGSERYDVMNTITSARIIANALIIVAILNLGFGVVGVAVTALLTRFCQRLGFAFYTFRINRGVQIRYRLWSSSIGKEITRYGIWAFLIVLATRIIYQTDLIVVGIFLGPTAVTTYAIAIILVDQLRLMMQTANSILTPRLSALNASGEKQAQQELILKWSFLSALLAIFVGVPLVVNGQAFIALWMGVGFETSGRILSVLVLPFFVTAPSLALSSYLFATSQHSIGARVQMIEAGLNLVLSIVLVRLYGLNGAAWGTAVPAMVCTGIVLPWFTCVRMEIPFFDFLRRTSVRTILPAAIYFTAIYAAAAFFNMATWIGFFGANAIPATAFLAMSFFLYLDGEDRSYLFRRFGIT